MDRPNDFVQTCEDCQTQVPIHRGNCEPLLNKNGTIKRWKVVHYECPPKALAFAQAMKRLKEQTRHESRESNKKAEKTRFDVLVY